MELANGTHWSGNGYFVFTGRGVGSKAEHPYSTSGSEVIEIMEREGICVDAGDGSYPPERKWSAWFAHSAPVRSQDEVVGPTVRIAVCRCFVASKLGDEVDVPEELLE